MENDELYQKYIVVQYESKSINISVEVFLKKIVPHEDDTESIYCAFPLFGSVKHRFPFFINSPDFITTTERNALILTKSENGEITSTEKNRSILMDSIELYRQIIIYFKEKKYTKIYELTYGLNLTEEPYDSFDLEWYQNTFQSQMRLTFAENIILHTFKGQTIKLIDAYFPKIEKENELIQHFIELVSLYYDNIISKEDYSIWKNRIWDSLNFVSINDLIDNVIEDNSLTNEKDMKYLNNFLSFIWKYDKNLLNSFRLIPDMNNEFQYLTNDKKEMKKSNKVPDHMIQIMESIHINWKSTHVNNLINSIDVGEDNMKNAENRVINHIKSNNKYCLDILQFVLKDNEFRQKMFNFVVELKMKDFNQIIISGIDQNLWNFADDYVLHKIVEIISKYDQYEVQNSIPFLIQFLPLFQNYYYNTNEDFLNKSKIIPNANYNLKTIKELSSKLDCIHDFLNPMMIEYFNVDFNEKIIHPKINQAIKSERVESIEDYFSIINEKIKKLPNEEQLIIAESLVSIIPQKENEKQKKIFSLYHDLINQNLEEIALDEKLYEFRYWDESNQIILSYIINKVEETKSISNFKNSFEIEDEDKIFDILNTIYSFDDKLKIIPNKKGDFMYKDDLKNYLEINDDLLETFEKLDPNSKILQEIAHEKVKNIKLDKKNIHEFYANLVTLFKHKENTPELIEIIKKINYVNTYSFIENIISKPHTLNQQLRTKILMNAHISFIKHRIQQLETPKQEDFKRWPFELIQNAMDTINKENRKINIKFIFAKDSLSFIHDGSEFTNETLFALLYQCSEGKEDNKAIGRFGTGWLSTLILSRECHISGDLKVNDSNIEKIFGFDVTVYRHGKTNNELQRGVEKMEESFVKTDKIKGKTCFKYNIDEANDRSIDAYNKGQKSLRNNIPIVLILNPSIESISIEEDNEMKTYIANHEIGPIQSVTIKSNKRSEINLRYIRFCSDEHYSTKDVHIDCMIPIGKNNNIIPHNTNFFLFHYQYLE